MSALLWLGLALVAVVAPLGGVRPASSSLPTKRQGAGSTWPTAPRATGRRDEATGPMAPYLRVAPTNLAVISTRHEGVFPTELIQRIVDGRQALPLHGSAMPIWAMILAVGNAAADELAAAKIRAIVVISARSRIAPASEVVWRPPQQRVGRGPWLVVTGGGQGGWP